MNKQLLLCRFQPSCWASITLWLYYHLPSFSGYRGLPCECSPYKRCVEQETRHHIPQIEHVAGVSEITHSMIWRLTKTTRLEDDIHPPISECLTVHFYQHSTNYEPIKRSMCRLYLKQLKWQRTLLSAIKVGLCMYTFWASWKKDT